jgi:hypothetical protein
MDEATAQSDASPEPDPTPPPSSAMEAVTRRFMRYLGEDGAGLTGIWGLIAVFNLGTIGLSAAIQYRTGVVPYHFDMLQDPAAVESMARRAQSVNLLGLLIYPLTIISSALYYASFRSMRAIEDRSPTNLGFGELRAELFSGFGSAALASLLYMVVVGIGALCCILPGLVVAFIFLPAPYIASKKRFGVFDGFSEAWGWLKRHTSLFVVSGGVSVLVGIGVAALQYVAITVFVGRMGQTGILVANGAVWLLGVVVGYFAWMFIGSIFVTIDLAEERLGR